MSFCTACNKDTSTECAGCYDTLRAECDERGREIARLRLVLVAIAAGSPDGNPALLIEKARAALEDDK